MLNLLNKDNINEQKMMAVKIAGYRLFNLFSMHFLERLLFLGVAIVLPLKLVGMGEMSIAQTGLFYSFLLFMYRCTPLLFSYISRYIRREFILVAGITFEGTSLLLMAYSQNPQLVYGFALLAGIGGGATTTMMISLLESADRDSKSLKGSGINHDIFNIHLMLINASAIICPLFAFLSTRSYQILVTLIIVLLLTLLGIFFRLGRLSVPERTHSGREEVLKFDLQFFLIWIAALSVWAACSIVYAILPSLDSHFLGQDGVNIWLSFDAIIVVVLFFLLRRSETFQQNTLLNASIGLIAILTSLLAIMLGMNNFCVLLGSLVLLAFGGYTAFGQLYGLAMQTRFTQRKTFYLGLLSFSGALGEGGTQAIFWITQNAKISLMITFAIVWLGLVAIQYLKSE